MKDTTWKQQFGLIIAGISALTVGIELIAGTLDAARVGASTVLIVLGVLLYLFGGTMEMRTRGTRSSISELNATRDADKEARKARILTLFGERTTIQNDDVEQALDVSDGTATNYLAELVEEGKLEQIGESGRGVSYKKV